jgi:1-deoxy-D-xylulose-5-phosphate reductoisomerase
MNAANEIVVKAFLHEKIRFLDMPGIIEQTMSKVTFLSAPSLDDYAETDSEARVVAGRLIRER